MTTPHRSRLAGLVAAALVAAAGLVGLTSGPAAAALCPGAGVNVVVDFGALGGGVQKSCDPNGADKSGQQVFPAAGFNLDYLQPGYVCQVSNRPANGQPCQATDAYWGLFWSDGKSGKWSYATRGVGGQSAPEGGFLAFAWQGSATRRQPGTSPTNTVATPTKTPTPAPVTPPTKKPTKPNTPKPTKTAKPTRASTSKALVPPRKAAPRPTPTRSARPTSAATATAGASAATGTTPDPSGSAEATPGTTESSPEVASAQNASSDFTPDDEQSGLPPWIPVTVVLALALAAFGGLWWRNRSGTS